MTVSADWQVEYNGLLLGDGTEFDLVEIDGFLDLPEVRSSDRTLLLRDGVAPGRDNLGGRSVTLTVDVWPSDPSTLGAKIAAFQAAFSIQHDAESLLNLQIPAVAGGGLRQFSCRTRRRSAPLDLNVVQGHCQFVVQLDGADPAIYDATAQSVSTNLPTSAGGLTFNATPNLAFGAMPSGGRMTALNSGNYETYPTIRVSGASPAEGFTLENQTTGQVWSTSTVLQAGQWLDIDMNPRNPSVLLNGVASRFIDVDLVSSWWSLPPDVSSSIAFYAPSSASTTATLTWRSAWV